MLTEYMDFCGQEYAKILKHGSTRWLSMERCLQRILEKDAGLKSYFRSENFADSRFERLHRAFENPLTEVALFLHHASFPLFTNFNKLLQSDEPVIHVVHDLVRRLAKTLANRIVKSDVVKQMAITEINLDDPQIYTERQSIHLGGTTKFFFAEAAKPRRYI